MEIIAAPIPAPPAPVPAPPPGSRLRAFLRLDWWPRSDKVAAVPAWAHALFWGGLLLLDGLLLFAVPDAARSGLSQGQVLRRVVLTDLLAAAVFYTNWLVLIPRTLSRGRLGLYIGGVLLLLLAYLPLRAGISQLIGGDSGDPRSAQWHWALLVPYTLMGLAAIFFSSALRVTGDYLQALNNRRALEHQQLLTELAMLKAQINPHFLFNTLNNIYSLTSRKSDRAPEAVLRLAEIMRYLLYESGTDTVPLSRELTHLHSFLDLQRLRLSAAAAEAIRFGVEGTPPESDYPIAPLLLLPLVENAFKHGDLAARPVAVDIALTLSPGQLTFRVLNYVAPPDDTRQLPEVAGGVGLANLRRRLDLLYPGRHALVVEAPPGQHRVTLTLRD